ncbi:MAG: prepilin-type N-terminal cleavage/methylation domain-containing protein [Planctomycetota bacterium]
MRSFTSNRRGFSLIELVIVVVILGIIGAIAIPRMSRGAEGASESALRTNLQALRSAIELYAAEHGGAYPSVANFEDQMLLFSDHTGATNATNTGDYIYGPYLRAIPPLPVGANRGDSGVAAADGAGVGWIYNATTGAIQANTENTEVNGAGVPWNSF